MVRNKTRVGLLLAAASLASSNAFADVGYTFDITTDYLFSPVTRDYGPDGNPDTGRLTIKNDGSSTFTGVLTLGGTSPGDGTQTTITPTITLAPGASLALTFNTESSNRGGWNVGLDALFTMAGLVGGTEPVNLSVFDGNIHSGVFRLANGTPSDSYVLQGGDPFGGDTGDAFETTQAPGHFQYFETQTGVPDTGASLSLLGLALGRLGLFSTQTARNTGTEQTQVFDGLGVHGGRLCGRFFIFVKLTENGWIIEYTQLNFKDGDDSVPERVALSLYFPADPRFPPGDSPGSGLLIPYRKREGVVENR